MKSRKGIVWLAFLLVVVLIVFCNRSRIHFDWGVFWLQLRHVSWVHIAAGIALIYATFWLRATRWSVFLSAAKKVSPFVLVGPQFVGFAAVSLFGRLADVIRPALVARRVQLSISSQVAVYAIERMCDLGAVALIFSGALLFAPRNLPHHEIFVHAGMLSLAGTALIALFAVVVRVAGGAVAELAEVALGWISKPIGESVAQKIRGFRDGLDAIRSARDFLAVSLMSLAMWGMIGSAYVQTLHAFVDTPQLATISFSRTMLLMGASLGGSALQLPVLGWFTQIAVTAAAMHELYGAPIEAATACGALLLVVTFLSIIPTGLVFARIDHVDMKKVAAESRATAIADDAPGTTNSA
ncbi:MAG: lysylphosphatidylglycerol synthase transmembrane domain-containing protein [Acidobacteriaceae bacterium]